MPDLEESENINKCLRYGFEWPRKTIGDVHHDFECGFEAVIGDVHCCDVHPVPGTKSEDRTSI